MKQYPYLVSKPGKAILAAYLCAALYLSRDSMYALNIWGFYPAQYAFLALTALLGLGFVFANRHSLPELLRDRRILLGMGCMLLVLLPPIVKKDWQLMYVNVLLCIWISLFLSFFTSIQEVSRLYIIIMTVLGVYSILATYLFRIPADRGMMIPATFNNASGFEFYNYYLSNVSVEYVKNRNFGIFREPGVYQFFLVLGLYLNNYQADWKNARLYWFFNVAMTVTLLSTFATGGVLSLGLFVVLVYFDKKWYRSRQGRILGISAVGLFLAAVAFIVIQQGELYMELYRMLEKFGNGSDSITDRVGSPLANLKLFFSSPLWGAKLGETLHGMGANTSSSTILYAILGIFGGSVNVAGWFALVWEKKKRILVNLILLAILALAFNTQNLITNPYLWLFPMMALARFLINKEWK